MTLNQIIEYLGDVWMYREKPTQEQGEAIGECMNLLQELHKYRSIGTVEQCREAMESLFENANLAQEVTLLNRELRRYNKIGTPDECRAAAEKQRAKKPIRAKWTVSQCPTCGADLGDDLGDGCIEDWVGKKFCDCGQRISWETEE